MNASYIVGMGYLDARLTKCLHEMVNPEDIFNN
jgi:hypothetical protein